MRKTIQDVAHYLKEILVSPAPESYAIRSAYAKHFQEEAVHKGVAALRMFLMRLFDAVRTGGAAYDLCKKVAHEYENRISLSVYYPFLHHIRTMLVRIGYYGTLADDMQSLVCDSRIFSEKLSWQKNLQCVQFLKNCGICFGGIAEYNEKQSPAAIKEVKIIYTDEPAMLTGLKAMAIAEIDDRTLDNQDVFLRCDYRVLKKNAVDAADILKDTIKALSHPIRDFILQLHTRYLSKGLLCKAEIKGFHVYIKYSYKRKDLWGINASLSNGYHINVKTTNMHAYPDTIKALPCHLQELIAKGYGCGRKREIGRCDGGCRGMSVPLDESVLKIQDCLLAWFDQELLSMQK